MNPCYDHCYLRYEKEYDSAYCDENCDYAKAAKENKELKRILITLLNYYNYKECMYCKNYEKCPHDIECDNYNNYDLDLEKIKIDYNVR